MFSNPERAEISHRTMKLIVGVIAISLASVTNYLAPNDLESISESYHASNLSRDYFVGSLFAIFAFLLAYNGKGKVEMILSKIAAFAALGVAMFPCKCESHKEIIPGVHGGSAVVMFLILAVFCFLFRKRAKSKEGIEPRRREFIYITCGVVIVLSILVLAADFLMGGTIKDHIPRLTYYGEKAGLVAFGVAWLTASRVLPVITSSEERLHPFQ